YGLGLTDMAKEESGGDAALSRDADDPDGLRARILRVRPSILAFAAKRPALVFFRHVFGRRAIAYGKQDETLDGIRLFVLPSTSPAAQGFWDIGPWRTLAAAARNADDGPARKGGNS